MFAGCNLFILVSRNSPQSEILETKINKLQPAYIYLFYYYFSLFTWHENLWFCQFHIERN